MPVFLDTSFILALKNKNDKNNKQAQQWMKRFLKNEFGKIFTSTFVFDELVTLIMVRLNNLKFAKNIGDYILNSPRINLLTLSRDDFSETWKYFQKYGVNGLSFTDCAILIQCKAMRCKMLATFDRHFIGLIGTNIENEN